jgi:aerobic carbon-monoxide dehydrogenase medium subunit
VIPSTFEYERAESAEHAVQLLGQLGDDAKLLAGGHSLIPLMRLRLAGPTALVDIGKLDELAYVRDAGDHIAIGAMTRHETVNGDALLREHCPLLAHAAGLVGDPQVRRRGTIGGASAHGDPASDLPSTLLALGASFVVRGASGERTVPASDFFRSFFEVDVGPDELLTEVRVPKTGAAGWSYQKFNHRAQDWATVGVAALVERSNGSIARASVAFTSMGEVPIRAAGVEAALASGASVADAAEQADQGTSPVSDPFGSAEYRRALAKVLTRRAIEEALSS